MRIFFASRQGLYCTIDTYTPTTYHPRPTTVPWHLLNVHASSPLVTCVTNAGKQTAPLLHSWEDWRRPLFHCTPLPMGGGEGRGVITMVTPPASPAILSISLPFWCRPLTTTVLFCLPFTCYQTRRRWAGLAGRKGAAFYQRYRRAGRRNAAVLAITLILFCGPCHILESVLEVILCVLRLVIERRAPLRAHLHARILPRDRSSASQRPTTCCTLPARTVPSRNLHTRTYRATAPRCRRAAYYAFTATFCAFSRVTPRATIYAACPATLPATLPPLPV